MARTKASEQQKLLRVRTKADLIDDARRYWLRYRALRLHLETYHQQMEEQRRREVAWVEEQNRQTVYIPVMSSSSSAVCNTTIAL